VAAFTQRRGRGVIPDTTPDQYRFDSTNSRRRCIRDFGAH
jgi:hypothetical protein